MIIKLGDTGKRGRFNVQDASDLLKQISDEVVAWSKLTDAGSDQHRALFTRIQSYWVKCFELLKRLKDTSVPIEEIRSLMNKITRVMPLVLFSSHEGVLIKTSSNASAEKYLQKFMKLEDVNSDVFSEVENQVEILYAMDRYIAQYIDSSVLPDSRLEQLSRTISAAEGRQKSLDKSLSNSMQRFDTQSTEMVAALERQATTLTDTLERLRVEMTESISVTTQQNASALVALKEHSETLVANMISDFDKHVSEYKAVIDAAKNKEILDLPLRRWVAQKSVHARNSILSLKIAALSAVLTILGAPIASISSYILAENFIKDAFGGLPRLIFATVSALICLTFGIWATRLSVRAYMTEQHLKNDADNRVSITNAFIKLQAAIGLTDDDRKLLLQTIMRPVQDGIVQDDGLPNGHPAAYLVELLHPKEKKS